MYTLTPFVPFHHLAQASELLKFGATCRVAQDVTDADGLWEPLYRLSFEAPRSSSSTSSAPPPSAHATTAAYGGGSGSGGSGGGSATTSPGTTSGTMKTPNHWVCSRCTLHNPWRARTCGVCRMRAPVDIVDSHEAPTPPERNWRKRPPMPPASGTSPRHQCTKPPGLSWRDVVQCSSPPCQTATLLTP